MLDIVKDIKIAVDTYDKESAINSTINNAVSNMG